MSRRSTRLVLIGTVLAIVIAPGSAIGSGFFSDVPDSHTFSADIDWLASVGVTKGCNPPINDEFCPDSYVTRGQMSAFMHRLAASQAVDAGTIQGMTAADLKGGDPEPVGEVVMRQGGGGWLANGFEPPSTFKRAGSYVIAGGGYAVMGLVGPASMGGIEYELQSVTYCIFGASAADYVSATFVSVGRTAEDHVVMDFTKRETDGCYVIPVGASGTAFSLGIRMEGSELRAGDVETAWVPVDLPGAG